MRLLKSCHLPRSRIRIPFIGLAVLLSACQFVAPAPAPESRLLPADPSTTGGTADGGRTGSTAKQGGAGLDVPELTYTVQRGTLRSTLAMSGKVVPTRTAQLSLRGSGTVSSVHVRPGQAVKEGEPLIEFALDYESLQNARTQATLAELAYESEQAKLDQLKAGGDKTPLEQLNATIAKDRAEIQKLELDQAQTADISQRAEQARAVQREAADRKVALAQVQLQGAQEALADARAAVQRAQDNTQATAAAAADRAKNDQEQAVADARAGVETAQAALRSAERKVQEGEAQVAHAKLLWNGTKAQQEIAALQLRVSKDQQDVQETAALVKSAKTPAEAASATLLAAQARRSLQVDQLALDQSTANLGAAKVTDEAEIKAAQIALEQAKDDQATAQVALQRAQEKVARVSRDPGTPRPNNGLEVLQVLQDPDTLQARVRDAEHRVDVEKLNLADAQAARANVDVQAPDARDPRDLRAPVGSLSLEAAKAQLEADAARVAQLQTSSSGDEVKRQETRVNLLKDQAAAAAAAAQPVVVLKAPFDATVTDLGVSVGQTITPQAGAVDTNTSASGALTGQTNDGRQVAVRLAGAGVTSILANIAETDVSQLSVGQDVSLTFPGLPGQDARGTITEIAAAPTVQGNSVNYPIRVDVPNAPPQLKVGMSVQLTAEVDEARDVLLVPLDAIRNVSGQALVGKIDTSNGVVQDVPVNVGRTAGLTAELTSGVDEGDVVALYTTATASAAR